MTRSSTAEIEPVGGRERYQRLYLPTRLTTDSTYPFRAGEGVRCELVSTTCGREVLVVVPETLSLASSSSLTLERSTTPSTEGDS